MTQLCARHASQECGAINYLGLSEKISFSALAFQAVHAYIYNCNSCLVQDDTGNPKLVYMYICHKSK